MSASNKNNVPIPQAIQDINLEWLNQILNPHDITVEQFKIEGDAKADRGALSDLNRVRLQVRKNNNNSNPEELSIVIKSLPSDPNIRAFTLDKGYGPNEVQMYTKVLPAISSFLKSRGVSAESRFGTPFCYYGSEEGEGQDYKFILVLEDLLHSGHKFWDSGPKRSYDWNHASAAIRGIALLHAASLAYKAAAGFRFYEEEFPKFIKHMVEDPALDAYIKSGFEATRNLFKGMENEIPEGLMQRLDLMEQNFKPIIQNMVIELDPSDVNVIRHTDLHFFNMAFAYDKDGNCDRVKWFDFQNASEGRPIHDLGFLLQLNCDPEFSSTSLDRSLELYHETFMGLLKEAKIDLDYSIEMVKKEFSRYRLPSILHIISGAPFWTCGPNSNEVSRERLRKAITYAYSIGELEIPVFH